MATHEKRPFNLSRWAIGHPSIARFLFGLIIVAGALGLMRMGQKEDPDFTFSVMLVQAVWPGASIQEMEDQVVNKIERKLQETPHLDFVRSYTRAGSAIGCGCPLAESFGMPVTVSSSRREAGPYGSAIERRPGESSQAWNSALRFVRASSRIC